MSTYLETKVNVRDFDEIKSRMKELEAQLDLIERRLQVEAEKPFFDRAVNVCHFLIKEKRMFLFALDQLKWVLYE
jgi:hypothetical protein